MTLTALILLFRLEPPELQKSLRFFCTFREIDFLETNDGFYRQIN